jgi:hypothetical protein
LAQQGRLVVAQRVNTGGLRCCVAVVAGESQAAKPSREIRETLLVSDLKAGNISASCICRLLHQKARELSGSGLGAYGNNRITQVFVEEARLNQSQRAEELLEEQVVVIGVLRLKIRIA